MGTYVSIRGWIECSEDELPKIKSVISSFVEKAEDYGLTREGAEMYNKGWVLPESHINWTHYIFYGADIRIQCIDYIKDQLKELSRKIFEIDGDITDYLYGIFHIDHEEEIESFVWKISDGGLYEKEQKI